MGSPGESVCCVVESEVVAVPEVCHQQPPRFLECVLLLQVRGLARSLPLQLGEPLVHQLRHVEPIERKRHLRLMLLQCRDAVRVDFVSERFRQRQCM